MRAAVLTKTHSSLEICDLTPTAVEPGEVLVRVGASGLCRSDLSVLHMDEPPTGIPAILGHEGAGVVVEIGPDVETLKVGDRVIASWVPACGRCFWCIRGQAHLCDSFQFAGARGFWRLPDGGEARSMCGIGTLAEMMLGTEYSFVKVDTDLPDDYLSLIGCAVTTGVCAAINVAPVVPGSSVAVFGCGGVGTSIIQGARIAGGTPIIAVDPVALKRDAAIKLGATHAVDPAAGDPIEAVKSLTGGRGVDFAFEAAGRADTATWALHSTRRGGTAICVGGGAPDVSTQSTLDAKTVRWTLYGNADPRRDFARLVTMVENGTLDVDAIVSRRITLDEVNEGFAAMERGEVIRSIVVI